MKTRDRIDNTWFVIAWIIIVINCIGLIIVGYVTFIDSPLLSLLVSRSPTVASAPVLQTDSGDGILPALKADDDRLRRLAAELQTIDEQLKSLDKMLHPAASVWVTDCSDIIIYPEQENLSFKFSDLQNVGVYSGDRSVIGVSIPFEYIQAQRFRYANLTPWQCTLCCQWYAELICVEVDEIKLCCQCVLEGKK